MTDAFVFSLIAGMFVGLSAGYVGSLMVLKKMALVGDALSHVALPGLALGILFNFNPFIGAFALLFASAVVTWHIERITRLSMEAIVGVMFTFALALGILITPEPDLLEALFGNISKVDFYSAAISVAVSIFVVFLARIVYKRMVLGMISEDLAVSNGVNVSATNLLYLLLVSLVVSIGIKLVGTLLVGALVVVPAAAAKSISNSLSRYSILSSVLGVASSSVGILLSGYLNVQAGPMVVVTSVAIFLMVAVGRAITTHGYSR